MVNCGQKEYIINIVSKKGKLLHSGYMAYKPWLVCHDGKTGIQGKDGAMPDNKGNGSCGAVAPQLLLIAAVLLATGLILPYLTYNFCINFHLGLLTKMLLRGYNRHVRVKGEGVTRLSGRYLISVTG